MSPVWRTAFLWILRPGTLGARDPVRLCHVTPGDVLGSRYELESRLGKGGMGEVWRARHLITNERVAVKVLLDDLAQDGVLQKRFLREARAAAAVKHPNVVELR